MVLNSDLRVVSANPSFYRNFKVTPKETKGGSFMIWETGSGTFQISGVFWRRSFPKTAQVEDFLVEHDFPEIGRRRMLLNARRIAQEDSQTQLILLAIEDITDRRSCPELQLVRAMKNKKAESNLSNDLRLQAEERLKDSGRDSSSVLRRKK